MTPEQQVEERDALLQAIVRAFDTWVVVYPNPDATPTDKFVAIQALRGQVTKARRLTGMGKAPNPYQL